MRVLIVEDEPYLAEAVRDGLRLEAIAADIAGDGDSALELLGVNAYDLAVLDRDIPGPSGDEVARHIVSAGLGIPILMLTAADRIDDKASGFGLGADDYLTKPFELRELVLRLRALDRRRAYARPPVREIAGLRLDPFRREVFRDGRYVALTRKQFAVLEVLVAAEGGVVSAEDLLERAWDANADPLTNAVRITVSALRKRLGEPWVIATVPGVGYRIDVGGATVSVRLKLTLSYAGFLLVAGALLLGAVWVFLLRHVPDRATLIVRDTSRITGVFPVRSNLVHFFAPRAAAVLAILLVFGLAGGWILAGRMLAPLARITDATRRAAGGSLAHRIRLPGRRDEFGELADAFDAMLGRLEAHVAEQRRFAANASHELRTPLAITRALLDVAREDPARGRDDLVDRLQTVNTRAIDLTEALLLLSRGDRFSAERVDLSLIAEEAAETLLPIAEQRRITLDVTGEGAPAGGSPELLSRMVTNLVQNAIVHNLPAGGTVTVATEAHGDTSVLRVANTGRRIPPELVPTLTEPFRRGTDRVRTAEHAGAGLGLAIVHSIVRAHDGTLDLAPGPAGGLAVTVRLPAR